MLRAKMLMLQLQTQLNKSVGDVILATAIFFILHVLSLLAVGSVHKI